MRDYKGHDGFKKIGKANKGKKPKRDKIRFDYNDVEDDDLYDDFEDAYDDE